MELKENQNDEDFMRLALSEAEKALAEDEFPVGCVAVFNGKVYGRGRRIKNGNPKLDHAEIRALRDALKDDHTLADFITIYTTLEPCVMCYGAILHSRVARVVYALEDPYGGVTHITSIYLKVNKSRCPP